jgi:hypothetical protein
MGRTTSAKKASSFNRNRSISLGFIPQRIYQKIIECQDKLNVVVLVTPKEMKFPEGTPVTEFALNPEEVTLNLPLPPSTGRVLIIGFSLLEAKPESITFEIQMNPPDGEKKTVKWEGGEPR